jgi:hypothetical protein
VSVSAFAIGGKVWLVGTEEVASDTIPQTLPLGSIILTPDQAVKLGAQIHDAGQRAARRQES